MSRLSKATNGDARPPGTAFVLTHESDPGRRGHSMSIIALALTRSLGRQGVPVVRIHPNRLDLSLLSTYCSKVEVSPDFYQSEEDLLAFLLEMKGRYLGKGVLIPASDDCAYFVAKYRDALSAAFKVAAPAWPVMQRLLDKRFQYEQAQRLGIPIPETYFPTGVEDVRRLARELVNYPYVIKPLTAHTWRLASMRSVAQGKKGFAATTPEALISQYEAIAQGDKAVMIQEVIGGEDERLFTFLSYFNEDAMPLGYCIRKKVRQLPVDFGYCTLTVSCFDPVIQSQSLRLLSSLGYEGISGIEWKLDPRTGEYKLIEINARAVNTIALASACGVDLPYLAFRDKMGAALAPVTSWQAGIKWINFEQDLWAARKLYQLGKLSLFDWLKSISGKKVHAVFSADDSAPFVAYFVDTLKRRFAGKGNHLLKPVPQTLPPSGVIAAPVLTEKAVLSERLSKKTG